MWELVDKRAAGKNHDKILTQAEAITTRVQDMHGVFHISVCTETPAWLQTCSRTEVTMKSDVQNTYRIYICMTHFPKAKDGNLQTMLVPSSGHCGPDTSLYHFISTRFD